MSSRILGTRTCGSRLSLLRSNSLFDSLEGMRSCNSCKRYVRESKCVFCGSEDFSALPKHSTGTSLSRAAMILGAAATAAALTTVGCSSKEPDCDASDCVDSGEDGSAVALYGAVPMDAAGDTAAEDTSTVALYGAVPADASSPDGTAAPAYGAPG